MSILSYFTKGTRVPTEVVHAFPKMTLWLTRVIDACLYASIVFVPLFFFSGSSDILELPKQTIFGVLMVIGLLAWLGKALAEKHFSLSRGWLHIAVALFTVGYLLVALFSQDRYSSFIGTFGQISWSFSTILLGVVLYALIVNRLKTTVQVYHLLLALIYTSGLAAFYGLLQVMGWFILPSPLSHNPAFTTVGSVYSLTMYLAPIMVMASALLFHGCRERVCVLGQSSILGKAARIGVWATLGISLLLLLLVDSSPAWLVLLLGSLLVVGSGFVRSHTGHRPVPFFVPALLALVAFAFLILQTPINLNLPSEVAPSMSASWDIARQTLQENPVFGSGPGTWIFDYAKYREQIVNVSPFWATRFDRSYSAFFTLLATVGLAGTMLWLLLIVSGACKSIAHIVREKRDELWYAHVTVFVGWMSFVFVAFVYNYSVPHQFAFWFLLALLGGLVRGEPFTWDAKRSSAVSGTLSAGFILAVVIGVSVLWTGGQRLLADVHFARGVNGFQNGGALEQVIHRVTQAATLNPLSDIYTRNLSQVYLTKALVAARNNPNKEQVDKIQSDAAKAVELARLAVERAPANVDNWVNLGSVYQGIVVFTRGADEFAIANYLEAMQREPANPVILGEIGRVYIGRADTYQQLSLSGDQKVRMDAIKNVEMNLKQAMEYLQKAVALKPDYLPAHYQLGLVYERQGRLPEAITELEQYLRSNNKDVGVAFELAILYYRHNGRDDKARAMNLMEQVVKAEPSNANAHWYLSFMYEEAGQLDFALEEVELLLGQYPNNASLTQRIEVLRKTRTTKAAASSGRLPEPLQEQVTSPAQNNPLKR